MSGRRRFWPALVAVPVAFSLAWLAACSGGGPPAAARHPIVVGVDLPLGGDAGSQATASLDEIRAVLSASFGGSVEGVPVMLHVLDDAPGGRLDPVQGERNLRSFAADPTALGAIGPLDSDVAEAEIPVASAAGLPLVSPAASAACLTRPLAACDGLSARLRGGAPVSFFRVVAADDLAPEALVRFATGSLHASRFAVASDGQAYGMAARDGFISSLRAAGHPAVFQSDFDPRSQSAAAAFAASAKTAGADAVFIGGRAEGGACLVAAQVAAVLGSSVPVLGEAGLLDPTCGADAAAGAAQVYAVGPPANAPTGAAARALFSALATAVKSEGGNVPSRAEVRAALARQAIFDSLGDVKNGELPIYQAHVPGPGQQPAAWVEAAMEPVSRG